MNIATTIIVIVGTFVARSISIVGKARVIAIDTKRRGYSHNVLLPRVFAWLKRLCALALCIAILISAPCSPFAPMRLERSTQGPPVLFDSANPDGVKLAVLCVDTTASTPSTLR